MAKTPESFEARSVLNTLVQRVDAAVVDATRAHWRCIRALPRVDGTLYFDLQSSDRLLRLNWVGSEEEGNQYRNRLVFSGPAEGEDQLLMSRTVDGVLTEVLGEENFSMLHYYNRGLTQLRFDDSVVDLLLAGRLTPRRTTWFNYLFQDVFQERSDRFRLTFLSHRGPVSFEVRPAVPPFDEDRLILRNGLLVIYLVEDCRKQAWRKHVHHQVERFVGFLLSRAVHPHMALELPTVTDSQAEDDRSPISTSRWGNPNQWYQFFSDFEIERSSLCACRFVDPISWVTHGEMECRWIEPELYPRAVTYTNVPWIQERLPGNPGTMSVYTTLGEKAVIMGGMKELEGALEKAIRNPGARLVCMNNTCLPKIIGDDVASAMEKFSRMSSIPILSINTDLDSPDTTFHDLVRQAREELGDSAGVKSRGSGLNLIGFPPNRGRGEIISDLKEMSIPVNVCLLPDIGIELLREYLQGKAGIIYPHGSWVTLGEKLLKGLGVPWQVLPAPYGLKRSLEWFQTAAEVMGREEAFEDFKGRRLDEFKEEWEHLVEHAVSFSLAFVVDARFVQRLVEPTRLYGFEILPLLEEMGFRLHVLIRQNNPQELLPVETATAALADPKQHTFKTFTNPEELSVLLREGSFDAVYSEVFFDTRISRAGKAQFSLSVIEMGLPGALRSLRRLLRLCSWPFYRSYRRYLGGE